VTTLKRRLAQHKRFPLRSVIPTEDVDWEGIFARDTAALWVLPEPVRITTGRPSP
jgi:hypothetical protein